MGTQSHPPRREAGPPPRHCPACGDDLSEHPYYQLHPSPVTRRLHTLARLLLPVMTVVFFVQLATQSFMPSFSVVSGYFIVAYICAPSMLVYSVSLLMPRDRRVICLHCSWYRDYPFRWGIFEAAPAAR